MKTSNEKQKMHEAMKHEKQQEVITYLSLNIVKNDLKIKATTTKKDGIKTS